MQWRKNLGGGLAAANMVPRNAESAKDWRLSRRRAQLDRAEASART